MKIRTDVLRFNVLFEQSKNISSLLNKHNTKKSKKLGDEIASMSQEKKDFVA